MDHEIVALVEYTDDACRVAEAAEAVSAGKYVATSRHQSAPSTTARRSRPEWYRSPLIRVGCTGWEACAPLHTNQREFQVFEGRLRHGHFLVNGRPLFTLSVRASEEYEFCPVINTSNLRKPQFLNILNLAST